MSTVLAAMLALAPAQAQVAHLNDFQVIEVRRYTIKDGAREQFAKYFESYFPEAFEQLGAIAFGQFFERDKPAGFTWLRGFRNMDARAVVNSAFYYGPLWKEHRLTLNNLMVDSDNVMLMRPLSRERAIPVLPAVDPVLESAAQGVVVAQVFALRPDSADAFAKRAEAAFAAYRSAGIREAGVLVTLDAPNNFPQLPVRTDGTYLVWLGVAPDQKAVDGRFSALATEMAATLGATGMLRGTPELIVLNPAPRSRLRWIQE
jgi:hypothetical protein